MTKSLIYSISLHLVIIVLTILSLPFMIRQPIDLPPIVSVELIQISDKTNIPFAPKARKIIEETKKRKRELFLNKLRLLQKQKKNPTEYHCQMIKRKKGNNKKETKS